MARIKPERSYAKEHLNHFGGIGKNNPSGSQKASDIQNLRICADGSLKKRNGYRLVRQFKAELRDYWEGYIGEKFHIFAISGNTIYSINPITDMPSVIGTLESQSEYVSFIEYGGEIYLLDTVGPRVYDTSKEQFVTVEPYVPLYGKDWDPATGGYMNEEFNLLTNSIRIHYLNTSNSTTFHLPFYADAVVGVRVNNDWVLDYSFTPYTNTVTLPAGKTGYNVEIGLHVMLDEDALNIRGARKSIVFPGKHHQTLCIYGSSPANRVFCSSYVDSYARHRCSLLYPGVKPLYFKESNMLLIGNTQYPLRSICRYGDRLLAFSRNGTWTIECPTDESDLVSMNVLLPTIGSSTERASIICNNLPLVVNLNGVHFLEIPDSDQDPPQLINISEDVKELLSYSFLTNCLARDDTLNGELWLCDPTNDADHRIFVYNYNCKQWYIFHNYNPDRFFEMKTFLGFSSKNNLYVYDETIFTDDDEPITASYQSSYFDFSHPEAKKRALRVITCANAKSSHFGMTLETERHTKAIEFYGSDHNAPDTFDCRALMGRFRFIRFQITLDGSSDCRIYSVSLYANL